MKTKAEKIEQLEQQIEELKKGLQEHIAYDYEKYGHGKGSCGKGECHCSHKEKPAASIGLESQILESIKKSTCDAIDAAFLNYSTALTKLAEEAISERQMILKDVIAKAFSETISSPDFLCAIKEELAKKIANLTVSANDSMIEKLYAEFGKDPDFKAKIVFVVDNMVSKMHDNNSK